MELIQNKSENSNQIVSVSESKIVINEESYTASCIVSNLQVLTDIDLTGIDELNSKHIEDLISTQPEVILFGSGVIHQFPNVDLLEPIAKSLVGFEVMTNSAAARTYNIMVAEERKVACLLII
jgi:uncharacterized protein